MHLLCAFFFVFFFVRQGRIMLDKVGQVIGQCRTRSNKSLDNVWQGRTKSATTDFSSLSMALIHWHQKSVNSNLISANRLNIDQYRPIDKYRPNIDQYRPNIDQYWPISTKYRPISTKYWPVSTDIDQISTNIDKYRQISTKYRPISTNIDSRY